MTDMQAPAPPPPGPPPAPPASSSNKGTMILVMGILSVVCCQLLGPVAWIMGSNELKAIQAGTSPAEGEGMAKAGMILGIIGSVFLALSLVWIFVFGGMAVLGGLSQ